MIGPEIFFKYGSTHIHLMLHLPKQTFNFETRFDVGHIGRQKF